MTALTVTQRQGKPCKRGHSGVRWKVNNTCVECGREAGRTEKRKKYKRAWARENPQDQAEWRANNRDRRMLSNARERAKRRNLPFNIDISDVTIPVVCPVFGTEFILDTRDPDFSRDNQATIDRIIPVLGYVKGNVRVISGRANRFKSDMTKADILRLLAYLEECSGD